MTKYVTRTFPKTVLQELLREDIEEFEDLPIDIVNDEIYDAGRWSIFHTLTFRHGDRFYGVNYSVGATEQQDERPFEYDSSDIVCKLMVKKEVVIEKYVPVELTE